MAFDPSVIGSIGDSFPDLAGAKGRGYQLKDLIDQEQLHALELRERKTDVAQKENIATALKGADLTSEKGKADAIEKIRGTAGALPAMKFAGDLSAMEKQKTEADDKKAQLQDHLLQIDKDKFANYKERVDTFLAPMSGVLQQYDSLIEKGVPPSQARQQVQPAYVGAVATLQQSGVFTTPQDMQHFQRLGPTFDPEKVRPEVMQSANMQKELASAEQRRSTERHQRTQETQGQERIDIMKRNATEFSGDTGGLLAALAERGVALPAGLRSKAQMKATLDGLIKRNQGKSVDQIADQIKSGQIEFGAEKKETQIAAGIAGKIRYAEEELNRLAPVVLQASEAVPRGKFVPFNKLKLMTEAQLSDPNLKKLKSYLTTMANAYDVLAARGGTDMEKRKHNRELFDTADSPEALKAAVDAVMTEAKISGQAAAASTKPREADTGGWTVTKVP